MEAVTLPDGASWQVYLHYRHTGKIRGTETVLDSEVKSRFSTVEETGAVAKVWALESKAGGDAGKVRYAALIVRPTERHPGGGIVREAIRR